MTTGFTDKFFITVRETSHMKSEAVVVMIVW
jgi:hypothetical protein